MAWIADQLTRQTPYTFCVDWHSGLWKKKRQNSAEHYWFEHLKHFVNFFSYKSLNGANDCCCCMLICTKIDFVGLPKYWLKDPSICIFICLYCTNLKFEYWVISIQRLGVIVVELVSKRDCKRSDFANCNQKKKITITLWGGPLRSTPGQAEVKRVQSTCWWNSSIVSMDVPIPTSLRSEGVKFSGATLDTFS